MASTINNNIKKPKKRKNKIELVFDAQNRREFLTGFHKRKLQKKKAAQEKLAQALKDERKRLKKEARETYKKLVGAHRPVPLLENLFSKEYEEDDVTVKVTELSTSEIASRNNWIGENKPEYEEEDNTNEQSANESEDEDIPGMELERKREKRKLEESGPIFSSKKDIKRTLMKEATLKMQESRPYQKKNRLEQQKNKKKSKRIKRQKMKIEKRKNKFRKNKK